MQCVLFHGTGRCVAATPPAGLYTAGSPLQLSFVSETASRCITNASEMLRVELKRGLVQALAAGRLHSLDVRKNPAARCSSGGRGVRPWRVRDAREGVCALHVCCPYIDGS